MYFNSSKLPEPKNEYVAWIDIMGTKNIMSDSLNISANFIFKFHSAIQASKDADAKYYPLMDGVFITTDKLSVLKRVIAETFTKLAELFSAEQNNRHRFLIKGSISFGPIIHGENVPADACSDLEKDLNYKKAILMGTPMIQAYSIEKLAPPFGVYIHESARTFAEKGKARFSGKFYQWSNTTFNRSAFLKEIENYFQWTKKYSNAVGLEKAKSDYYLELAQEYFNKFE
ncbi:hypothetical protein [uncultured Imperialibacter sp.]|uniref:hypothetical protein n=1 Tax=uncultured Imperialibacter sp. TaxID=1672639 RepID=UPI0030DAD7EA|tara:strand:+ start:33928 stop:34614 length:687 start_codon:yes stop_codon:yes gene_type:complete